MENVKAVAATAGVETIDHKTVGQESLAPQTTRIMDPWSYLFAWLGGCVSIATFTVGSGLVGTLNLLQVVVAISIGCSHLYWLYRHWCSPDDQWTRRPCIWHSIYGAVPVCVWIFR